MPTEYQLQKIADPNGGVDRCNHRDQQNHGSPIAAFVKNPAEKGFDLFPKLSEHQPFGKLSFKPTVRLKVCGFFVSVQK